MRCPTLMLAVILSALVASAAAGSGNEPKSAVNFCQGCREIVSFANRFNGTSNRETNKQLLREYFSKHFTANEQSMSDPTNFYVNGVYFLLERMDPVLHCDQIGACEPIRSPFSSRGPITSLLTGDEAGSMTPHGENEICATCEHLVDTIKQILLDPSALDELKAKVGEFCKVLKIIDQEDQCNQLAEKYLEQALKFVHSIDPRDYCRAIQLCGPKKASDLQMANRPVLADFNKFSLEASFSLEPKSAPMAKGPVMRPSPNCVLCKTIMKELFKFLHQNRTEENIRLGLDKVCKLIYPHNQAKLDQCNEMVAAYTRELIELLTEETDPSLLCILIEQCTYDPAGKQPGQPQQRLINEKKDAPTLGQLITLLDSSVRENSIEACVECRVFIEYLQKEIERPQSREQLKQFLLTKLCDSLQDPKLRDSCTQMVEAYSDIFFKAIAEELEPKKACIELGVCKAKSAGSLKDIIGLSAPLADDLIPLLPVPSLRPTSDINASLCKVCQPIVDQIDEFLAQKSISRDVATLVEGICPSSASLEHCSSMLDRNGHEIVSDLVSASRDARQICKSYFYC